MGVMITPPYEEAEFVVLAGEGQCGTGDHSSAAANRKRNRDESGSDEESFGAGRKSAKAFKDVAAARARRSEAMENMPKRRYARVRRILSKDQHTKLIGNLFRVVTKSQHASGQGINQKNQ